jgi:hypothetical protein
MPGGGRGPLAECSWHRSREVEPVGKGGPVRADGISASQVNPHGTGRLNRVDVPRLPDGSINKIAHVFDYAS